MSPPRSDDSGIPRGRSRVITPSRGRSNEEDWSGANDAKREKLRRSTLQRLARARGFELRHTAYGYALIDAARNRVDDRNDMTLTDVERCLKRKER